MAQSDNPPAFPRTGEGFGNPKYDEQGMSLRDWFAGQAIPLIRGASSPEEHAFFAYELADAMLAARQEKPHD